MAMFRIYSKCVLVCFGTICRRCCNNIKLTQFSNLYSSQTVKFSINTVLPCELCASQVIQLSRFMTCYDLIENKIKQILNLMRV